MKLDNGGRRLRLALVLCLAGLYFLLAMGVALMGTGIYRSVAKSGDVNSAQRTALSYVVNQVRRGDREGVAVGRFQGVRALRLSETGPDGSVYHTLIYCCGGQLRELYMEEGAGLAPEDGLPILPLEELDFTVGGSLLKITAAGAEGERWSVSLAPRTGVEEVAVL